MNLQETIRKVLREESRLKKTVNNYIEQFGLKQTSKMMGISLAKLVEISDHPIDSEVAHEILIENLRNKYSDDNSTPKEIVFIELASTNSKKDFKNMTREEALKELKMCCPIKPVLIFSNVPDILS
jgi:hypothetical protein